MEADSPGIAAATLRPTGRSKQVVALPNRAASGIKAAPAASTSPAREAAVITGAIGTYALGSVTKNNQARPLRRVTGWYNVQDQVHDVKVLHRGRQALKPGERQVRG